MNQEERSDEQLMQQIQAGDVAAFKELYGRYKHAILGFTYKMLRDRHTAEEILQETFWRIWRNADSFNRNRGSFPNWMFGIARNLCIDKIRRSSKVQTALLADSYEEAISTPGPAHHPLADQDVAEAAWVTLQREQVSEALAKLPAEQLDVVNAIYFQGKTRRQIAAEWDLPLGTVNTRARLALQKLKRSLVAAGIETPND